MPLLPGRALERMCGVLRCLWQSRRTCACWALYVHTRRRYWVPLLPPQWCDADGARVRLAYPPLAGPGPQLRLAGTCATAASPDADPERLAMELPPIDGLHLLWRPDRWLDAAAFVTAAGTTVPVPLEKVVSDRPDPADLALGQRLYVTTRP